MKLPQVVTDFIDAQNSFNSAASANCFAETGVMVEEGENFNGRNAIRELLEETNQKYRSVMKPVNYEENGKMSTLSAEVSGNFPGSPAILKFQFEIVGGKIEYLKVTG